MDKDYYRNYYRTHREKYLGYVKKYQSSKKGIKRISIYKKKYSKLPYVILKRNESERNRRKVDISYNEKKILYGIFRRRLNRFHKTKDSGISPFKKRVYEATYGIDFDKILNKLQPLPKSLKGYEVDHIIPLSKFDFTKKEDISKAYSPENIRLIPGEENRRRPKKY